MRTVGNIERFLVIGIVLVIGAILAVAIKGANEVNSTLDPKSPSAKAAERKGESSTLLKNPGRQMAARPQGPAPGQSPAPTGADASKAKSADLQPPGSSSGAATNGDAAADALAKGAKDKGAAGGTSGGGGLDAAPAPAPLPLKDSTPEHESPVVDGHANSGGVPAERPTGRSADKPAADKHQDKPAEKSDDLVYEVKSGDTLERIARSLWGDGALWKDLLSANPSLGDGALIHAGMKLKLPKAPTHSHENVSSGGATTVATASPAPANATTASSVKRLTSNESYEVQKGDTLMTIAAANYGSKSAWKLIYDANASQITDKDRIRVGTVLKLPAQ